MCIYIFCLSKKNSASLGTKVLVAVEAPSGPGKRGCWKGAGSLLRGRLKGTDVWRARKMEQEKNAGDGTSLGHFKFSIPLVPFLGSFPHASRCCHVTSSS